jgi:hypothetical protein
VAIPDEFTAQEAEFAHFLMLQGVDRAQVGIALEARNRALSMLQLVDELSVSAKAHPVMPDRRVVGVAAVLSILGAQARSALDEFASSGRLDGARYEIVGAVLRELGASERLSGRSRPPSLEALVIHLCGELARGTRAPATEQFVIDHLADLLGADSWDVFSRLDRFFAESVEHARAAAEQVSPATSPGPSPIPPSSSLDLAAEVERGLALALPAENALVAVHPDPEHQFRRAAEVDG